MGVVEALAGGFDEGGVGCVLAELPGHDSAELLLGGEGGLVGDGDGVFEGPKGAAVVEPWGVRVEVTVEDVGMRGGGGFGVGCGSCGGGGVLEGRWCGGGWLWRDGAGWSGRGREEREEVGVGAVAADALTRLKEAGSGGGHSVPAVAVEGEAEEEF